jgi:hypothetical protein
MKLNDERVRAGEGANGVLEWCSVGAGIRLSNKHWLQSERLSVCRFDVEIPSVIPAGAGIQRFFDPLAKMMMDAGLRRHDRFFLLLKASESYYS